MVTCTPPPDGIRHVYPSFIHSPSSSPTKTPSRLSTSPIRPAPAVVDKSTPTSLHRAAIGRSGMSPSVYDARPAYHHRDITPNTVPSIKVTAGVPLSAIRSPQAGSPSLMQRNEHEQAAKVGGMSMPLSPTQNNLPDLKDYVFGVPHNSYKSPHRHTVRQGNQAILPVQEAHVNKENKGKVTAEPVTPQTVRVQTSTSPRLAEDANSQGPDTSVMSIAGLRLQDKTSGTQYAQVSSEEQDQGNEVDELADKLAVSSLQEKKATLPSTFGEALRANFGNELDLGTTLDPFRRSTNDSHLSQAPSSSAQTLGVANPDLRASKTRKKLKTVADFPRSGYLESVGRPSNFSIKTSNGKTIKVHKENLLVMTGMLDDIPPRAKAMEVPENAHTTELLLSCCYPRAVTEDWKDYTVPISRWDTLINAIVAAEKYGMVKNPKLDTLHAELREYLDDCERKKNNGILKLYLYDDCEALRKWQATYLNFAASLIKDTPAIILKSITEKNLAMINIQAVLIETGFANNEDKPSSVQSVLPLSEK